MWIVVEGEPISIDNLHSRLDLQRAATDSRRIDVTTGFNVDFCTMRFLWAGLILLLSATGAWAQANGAVRGLGFAGNYRPDCWTPLQIDLTSTISEPGEYQIQVHQQDLDQDTVVFTRTVTLGPQARESVWIYFLPQPTEQGLPDASSPIVQLGDVLKVHLYDKKGRTHIASLPVQTQANNFESRNSHRGTKLVLVVASPRRAQPNQTRPTGLSALPPPGPATPVTLMARSARDRATAPSAMARATGSLTAPCAAIRAGATPTSSVLASSTCPDMTKAWTR